MKVFLVGLFMFVSPFLVLQLYVYDFILVVGFFIGFAFNYQF